MKKVFLLFSLVILSACETGEPWKKSQLIEPYELSEIITSGLDQPVIISIGPAGLIKNSIEVGECRFSENLAKLNDKVSGLSKNSDIVLYCGCCPFKDCPNIRPAFTLLNDLGFKNHRLLNLSNNLKTDWIDKNYPIIN